MCKVLVHLVKVILIDMCNMGNLETIMFLLLLIINNHVRVSDPKLYSYINQHRKNKLSTKGEARYNLEFIKINKYLSLTTIE